MELSWRDIRVWAVAGLVAAMGAAVMLTARCSTKHAEVDGSIQTADAAGESPRKAVPAATTSARSSGSGPVSRADAVPISTAGQDVATDLVLWSTIQRLVNEGLLSDLPTAASMLQQLQPLSSSMIEKHFAGFIPTPSVAALYALLVASNDELRQRRIDAVLPVRPDRPEGSEPERQIALREIIALEYAGVSGKVAPPELEAGMYSAYAAMSAPELRSIDDIRAVLGAGIERRVATQDDAERRWAAVPPERVVEDESPESRGRHSRRGVLIAAMENAARDGRVVDFNNYAARYLALPLGGSESARANTSATQRQTVEQIFRTFIGAR